MFENLSDKLQRVFKNLRGEGKLSADNMKPALPDATARRIVNQR